MLSALRCREFARQCAEWGAIVEPSQRPNFVSTARAWLALAGAIECAARHHGIRELEGFRRKLN
jgi:hypothetical protein